MEDRVSRRAALKVLAAGAVFGCSPEGDGDPGPLAPIVEEGAEPADASDYQGAVSYLATEQLQDIHGDPAPGSIYVYGVKDDVVHFIDGRRVGEDGYFERIPIHDQYSKILLAGVISSGVTAVTNVVSFTPLIDFSQDKNSSGRSGSRSYARTRFLRGSTRACSRITSRTWTRWERMVWA